VGVLKSRTAYRILGGGAGTGSKAFLACSSSPEKMSSYGDVAKGSSKGFNDCAGAAEDGAVVVGGGMVGCEAAGLAFIHDGGLTVVFGGLSDSFLNCGMGVGFDTGCDAELLFRVDLLFRLGSCSVARASRLGVADPETFFSRRSMNSKWSIFACLSPTSRVRFSR
jgi:hypothetical protein